MTDGVQFRLSYTWSKNIEAVSYRNATDSIPEHVVANLDRPHRFVTSTVYELPFGQGKPLLTSASGPLNHIVGGWQTQMIYQFQSGPPLNWGNVIFTGRTWDDIGLSGSARSLRQWFNTAVFDRNSRNQLASNILMFPSRISGIRQPVGREPVQELHHPRGPEVRFARKLRTSPTTRCSARPAPTRPTATSGR